MDDYQWDVFISYASEDRQTARRLQYALMIGGLKVWLDEEVLKPGDSLTRKIDEGLARSRFGVVILSKRFFEKKWPQDELAGLRARERNGFKVVLPVLHRIRPEEVVLYSPMLADLVFLPTADGFKHVTEKIIKVVLDTNGTHPARARHALAIQLRDLLENEPSRKGVISFGVKNPELIDRCFTRVYRPAGVKWNTAVHGVSVDAIAKRDEPNAGCFLHYFNFLPVWGNPYAESVSKSTTAVLAPLIIDAVKDAKHVMSKSDLAFGSFRLFAGRRKYIKGSASAQKAWNNIAGRHSRISLQSYDALIDALMGEGPLT